MARPVQQVKVFGLQRRKGDARIRLPHIVRYAVDGRSRSRSFRTHAEADRYRAELLRAAQAGTWFDEATGEPESWALPLSELRVHEWGRRWLGEQWWEWQPRTRTSAIDAIARFATLAVLPRTVPAGLRPYLTDALAPDAAQDPAMERWLQRHGLSLDALTREECVRMDRALAMRVDGRTPLAANTANRYRTTVHACVLAAVDAGALPADLWPRRSRARSTRKVARVNRRVDVRALPDPERMAQALAALLNHQPASRQYHVMTSVAYYAGLRPSEIVMVRKGSLVLPEEGWGAWT